MLNIFPFTYMSSRTLLILNFLLILVAGLINLFLNGNTLSAMILFTLLALVANAFMCVKALWNLRYKLAAIYFLIALIAIPTCIFLGTPSRIGH